MTNSTSRKSQGSEVERIYTCREAAKLFGVSIATWNRYVAAGLVPQPLQLGPRRVGWLASELAATQEQRRIERDARLVRRTSPA